MRAGKLRTPVCIVRPLGHESFGVGEQTYVEVRKCFAAIEPLSGGERINGQQLQQATTHRITLRVSPSAPIDSTCVVESQGRRFEIRSVIDVNERRRELVLLADEVVIPTGAE